MEGISADSSFEDYGAIPFVMSEELFIEFEQKIRNYNNPYKEYENIHNKAVFDALNESLNNLRPYYTLGGKPYAWTKTHINLSVGVITQDTLLLTFQKAYA